MKIEARPLTAEEESIIQIGFSKHANFLNAPIYNKETIGFVIYENNTLTAALDGDIVWDWLYIDVLYVDDAYRGQGLGAKLIQEAEKLASVRKLTGLYLTTQDWQAVEFYKKMGYLEYAVFDDFPKGYKRHCFRKYL